MKGLGLAVMLVGATSMSAYADILLLEAIEAAPPNSSSGVMRCSSDDSFMRQHLAVARVEDPLAAVDEERALVSGDNILGIGTAVIPLDTGDLHDYMRSLERVLAEAPRRIYPAHGPLIEDGPAKIREYIAHRDDRVGLDEARRRRVPRGVDEPVDLAVGDECSEAIGALGDVEAVGTIAAGVGVAVGIEQPITTTRIRCNISDC